MTACLVCTAPDEWTGEQTVPTGILVVVQLLPVVEVPDQVTIGQRLGHGDWSGTWLTKEKNVSIRPCVFLFLFRRHVCTITWNNF